MIKEKRQIELDLLRVVALLAVISIHCTGMGTDGLPITNWNAQVLLIFDCIVTWQIPMFVMISGRFFLDPQKSMPISKIVKSIWRLIVAFMVWDVVYQVYYVLSGAYSGLNAKGILSEAIIGPYHFWFIYMIICMYAITPFLRDIVKSKKKMEYFIILFFVFEFLTSYGVEIPFIGQTLSQVLIKTNFHFALGYSGYYILGYYLNRYPLSDKFEKAAYLLAVLCLVGVCVATLHRAMLEGAYNEWYTGYLKPNIIVEAVAIYTLFIKRIGKIDFPSVAIRCISKLSEYSFGVFLVHALVIELLAGMGISVIMINPLIAQPLIVFLSFFVSTLFVWLLRKIPIIGKKIT